MMNVDYKKLKTVLLVDDYSAQNVDLIRTVAKEIRSLSIVTTDSDKFELIKNELFEKKGIVLKVYEKSKTNFEDENVIINADFSSYDMNKLIISPNSLVICGFAKHFKVKNNFNGIVIKDVQLVAPDNTNENIDDLLLCEVKVYNYLRKMKENDRIFEREGYKINGYFGNNGKIMYDEFKRLGKIILDK